MCISVIYGPINQSARHRGNNSAAGKKERGLTRACENRGMEESGEKKGRGGGRVFFSPDRNFTLARIRFSRSAPAFREHDVWWPNILAAFIVIARTSPRAVYARVKQSPLVSHSFFSAIEIRAYFSDSSTTVTYSYPLDRRVVYLNSNRNALDSMRSFLLLPLRFDESWRSFNGDIRTSSSQLLRLVYRFAIDFLFYNVKIV